jgi:hypothetical protein
VKALLNHSDGDVTATYARWHMFGEKMEAVTAIEAAVQPLMPAAAGASYSSPRQPRGPRSCERLGKLAERRT